MKRSSSYSSLARILVWLGAFGAIHLFIFSAGADEKLKPEQLVARHLESIGSAEARASLHSRLIEGTSLLTVRQGGKGQVEGQVRMASQGNMNLISMGFGAGDYAGETFAFDGEELTTSHFRPGQRSRLAQLLFFNDVIFKEGLIGGTLSASWPLLNIAERNPKLEYAGTKKSGGRQLHMLKYLPHKGSDTKITLFFDSETFQHVRTEYERDIVATSIERIAPRVNLGGQGQRARDARIKITEEFSNFKAEKGLTLPHTYKLELSVQSETLPTLTDWVFELINFNFSQTFEAQQFVIKN
ncbi:MAG: hypothetical protein ABJC05_05050 [Pyrinomonadaceae bacterium]